MEHDTVEDLHDNEVNMRSKSAEFDSPERYTKDVRQISEAVEKVEVKKEGTKGGNDVPQASSFTHMNTTGEVNMEASITSDDVVRAGGFGARDDIGSFLPVAIDSTDFESSLRDARDYEEPQGQISRPVLGWTEIMQSEEH
ncbi:hypothetical protein AQUCO_01400735v1 [Aquilegia coerulea]|uniref:Uncharacterized protein n=1 Tax=Aquilegia coerulea TaxID=218851 RepID=A0A2G5DXU7_AQUCA|nr:hypothetical protein AQUCO_01400735v1 [Aquilegia coerulea]PIA48332.1 hypothetical protein AQUCO_01400735v1 [Aquilegia coerulea]